MTSTLSVGSTTGWVWEAFGEENVFRDVDSLHGGDEFGRVIREHIGPSTRSSRYRPDLGRASEAAE